MTGVDFDVQVVTPLFSAGADPIADLHKEGIRPPSIRGALRFWFRAMMGGIVGGEYEKVKKLEGEIFGTTEKASKVLIRTEAQSFNPQPIGRDRQMLGLNYLGFSMTMQNKAFIPPEVKFSLRMHFRSGTSDLDKQITFGALWLLLHLGGLGSRSRRGFGALKALNEVQIDNFPSFTINATDVESLKNHLEKGLTTIKKLYQEYASVSTLIPIRQSKFSVLDTNSRLILINNLWDSWNDALNDVGMAYQGFRHKKEPDYSNIKNFLHDDLSEAEVERSALGLPLTFRYRSLTDVEAEITGTEHDRRASPLFIKVLPLANNKIAVLLMKLEADFLKESEGLKVKKIKIIREDKRKKRQIEKEVEITQPKSYQIIDNFYTQLKNQFGITEVSLS